MSSCLMMTHESDEDVDLEALRVAALKSRKPRYPRVNHNNLIPIVPVNVDGNVKAKIKQEKISPEREIQDVDKIKDSSAREDEKTSNHSGSILENDPDILSMDDKEEEDSLEKLMDQLEAEISGKAPIPSSKKSTKSKEKNKQNDRGDDEVELLQVKSGKEPKAIIEIRESASPEPDTKTFKRNLASPRRSPGERSRSRLRSRSRSRSFYSGGRSYRRSKSPYWSRSPHKSRSPYRRSRSPYWSSRRTRSKSRSPFRRYRSPGRKRSPFSRFSRSRSRSYGRRRSPRSLSPRRRSKSPFYRDGIPSPRRRNFNSPGRPRRSYTPKDGSQSPRRRSRSPRRVPRHSPYRRSKSPYRSRSPYRRTSLRRSQSPFLRRSKTPLDKLNSPNRSPLGKRHSNSPIRRSIERASSKPRSPLRRPGRPKGGRSRSKSPVPFKNRSPLKVVEKNKLDDRTDRPRDRDRLGRRHRSLSRENNRTQDRRSHRRGLFPSRKRSRSPKQNKTPDKNKEESKTEKERSPVPAAPLDPVLEARKKKFETLGEVDPTVDKKINLKAIKESTENPEEDEDALTINVENNLWDESEESEDEFESRFKSDGARRNRTGSNRTVLSFRNLRESDASKKVLNKPLTDENRRDRNHRQDPWPRNDRERKRRPLGRGRSEDNESSKSKLKTQDGDGKKSHRKPIVWHSKDDRKPRQESKDNEVSTTQTNVSENKAKNSEKVSGEKDKGNKSSDLAETDDFDKLISDFEKELESDTCFSTNEVSSVARASQEENRKPRISVKRDLFEPKTTIQSTAKQPPPRIVKISDASSTKLDKCLDPKSVTKVGEVKEKITHKEPREVQEGPEDYIEDDDFVLEVSASRQVKGKEEEDKQSDLRAVLSKRRNERLTKVVSLQENMPTRLVQSAFQGLGHKKLKKPITEDQDLELPTLEKSVKSTGVEGRRVLLLHRDKNPLTPLKYTVPEVKPDTTIHQRFPWSKERRKRKLHRQQDPGEELDQEEEEEGFEVEEEKHFRRFRLKRNITLSSQSLAMRQTILIHPAKRQKKARIWEKAVKFIEENESRIRTEVLNECLKEESNSALLAQMQSFQFISTPDSFIHYLNKQTHY